MRGRQSLGLVLFVTATCITVASGCHSSAKPRGLHSHTVATPSVDTLKASETQEPIAAANDVIAASATADLVADSSMQTPAGPEETTVEQSIDLTTALMLTTGHNAQIAYARGRIEESLAQVDRANALKLPSIRGGLNYNKHEGRIQDVAGNIIDTSRGSVYSGLGANAVGAGSPAVPGLVTQFHFADAIFQPRIAQRTASARYATARAVTNDQLLATAIAYTELLRTEQEVAIVHDIVSKSMQLVQTTGEFEASGAGLASDHRRARTELALRQSELIRAQEASAVAAARLAELIRWDRNQRLVPFEPNLTPLELVGLEGVKSELVATALTYRPELAESRHLVCEAVEKLRREKNAPLVPSVLLAASYGGLGGGLGGNITNYGDRLDADAVAYWEVRQLGAGEHAIQREARARIMQAKAKEIATMDRVVREVIESYTQVTCRKQQIEITDEAVSTARESFDLNWERIRNGQGLPIETLQSIQALATAQREHVRVISDYNMAQFTLLRSLGWPIAIESAPVAQQ